MKFDITAEQFEVLQFVAANTEKISAVLLLKGHYDDQIPFFKNHKESIIKILNELEDRRYVYKSTPNAGNSYYETTDFGKKVLKDETDDTNRIRKLERFAYQQRWMNIVLTLATCLAAVAVSIQVYLEYRCH